MTTKSSNFSVMPRTKSVPFGMIVPMRNAPKRA